MVVQHPHEARKKNRSLPLVELCLFGTKTDDEGVPNNDGGDNESSTAIRKKTQYETTADESESTTTNATNGETTNDDNAPPPRRQEYSKDFVMKTIIARRLGIYCDNDVMELLHDPNEVVVLVFPHEDALQLEDGLRLAEERCKSSTININRNIDNDNNTTEKKKMTLIFIDATWKYAKEMEKCTDSVNEWPENLIRVQITPSSSSSSSSSSKVNLDGSDDGWKTPSLTTTTTPSLTTTPFIERRFHIRTPPSSNHLCTAESIAWIVSRVEHNPVIYDSIMTALDYMVSVWN